MHHQAAMNYYEYVEDMLRPEDVHAKATAFERGAGIAQAFIFALVLTVLHAILLYAATSDIAPIFLLVVVHVIISAVFGMWTYGQYRAGADIPFMALLAATTPFMGIFGPVSTLMGIVLYVLFRRGTTSFQEWFDLIFPQDVISSPEEVYNKIIVGIDENPKAYQVLPFLEVMELGNEVQKRRAISRMTMKFHPRLSPAFHKALRDPSNAIRVQAATSVAKIESQFLEKLEMIEKARQHKPENLHVIYALAQYYDDYAYTGLLEREREILNREKAIETYKVYLQHDPNHQGAWMAIGRLLFRSKQWREAADWFRNAMERGWNEPSILLWYVECLYHLNDYTGLRQVTREHGATLLQDDVLPQEIRESLALWAGK